MSEHFDVIVAGGGMVGGLLAAALGSARGAGEPLSVCVLEAARPEPFEIGSDPAHDIRVSAVSVASERLFRAVGAWDGVIARRACRFRRMRVWDGEADAATHKGTQAGITMSRSVYEQRAMVATVSTALPQQDITWQRFVPTGPQAMLPLSGHHASLVWYHNEDEIQRIGDRIALVGDACHTVHPLAGQGVNLGMLDAGALAETLRDARLAGQDIGARRTLRRYERWRRGENAMMATILDGFHKAFSPQAAPVRGARALALDVAGHVNPARKLVTRYASGLAGDLPRLARTGEPG